MSSGTRGYAYRYKQLFPRLFVAAVLSYLFVPVAVTVFFSFTESPRLSLPVTGFTLQWYEEAFSNRLLADALWNSVILALVTALVSGALGTLFSFGVMGLCRRVREVLLAASLLPAVVPALVIGISLALFFRNAGAAQGLRNAAIGQIIVCLPFVILTMNSRLETFDFTTLEAARDLGASPWRAFRDITLPLIRRSLLSAVLLAMALSLDEFVVTWFNAGNRQTLPVLIWGLLRRGVDPSINALASSVLAALMILIALARRVRAKKS